MEQEDVIRSRRGDWLDSPECRPQGSLSGWQGRAVQEEGRTIDLRKAAPSLYLLCTSLLYSSKSTAGS